MGRPGWLVPLRSPPQRGNFPRFGNPTAARRRTPLVNPYRASRQRRRRAWVLGVAAVVAVSTAACGRDEPADTGDAAPPGNTVTMRLIAYKPDTVTVKVGDTVRWEQKDAGAHTVTSGTVEQGGAGGTERPDGKFSSGEIATGDTFEFTFDEAGTYPYFCEIHPATMRGEVEVR
jgi:plastocyanin